MQFIGDFLFRTDELKKSGGFYDLPYAWNSDRITPVIAAGDKGIADTQCFGFKYRMSSESLSHRKQEMADAIGKLRALLQAERFYDLWLQNEPEGMEDKIYYREILQLKSTYFKTYKSGEIIQELMVHPFDVFKWFRIAGKYGISKREVLGRLIRAVYYK
jgi:hypothetical protein